MKERPILFSGPMVRALLEGRKTQTRRVVKPMPDARYAEGWYPDLYNGGPQWNFWGGTDANRNLCGDGIGRRGLCPYGVPGDRLWVKETWWMHDDPAAFDPGDGNVTDAKGRRRLVGWQASMDADSERVAREYGARKRSSIHMPRWASRITLEVVGVRVERVQEIDEWGAYAEGISKFKSEATNPVAAFYQLWESINGNGSWAANPWVWVVEFKRIGAKA